MRCSGAMVLGLIGLVISGTQVTIAGGAQDDDDSYGPAATFDDTLQEAKKRKRLLTP